MSRITRKQVDSLAETLCESLGLPKTPYAKIDGRSRAQIGCIHVNSQNYTNNIYQINNDAGGCRSLACGLTLRECEAWLRGALTGVQLTTDK